MASFHNFEPESIDGTPVPLSQYQDRVCLVVNLASE